MGIKLSERARRYYSYQRCATKNLSQDEVEEFAYRLHYNIFCQFEEYLTFGSRSLDFGCGIGVINIFTGRFFEEIYLVDSSICEKNLEKTYYGFHGRGYKFFDDTSDKLPAFSPKISGEYCFYNDLDISVEVVSNNLDKKIFSLKPDELTSLESGSFDFIQSHMSWGWHFPLSSYKESIFNLLKTGGIIVVDIRNNSLVKGDLDGFAVLDKLQNKEKNSRKYVLEKIL